MGTLTIATFMTLDGIMQAPGGPDEDRDGGFEYGGWSFPYFSEDMGEPIDHGVRQRLVLPARTPDLRDLRRQLAQLPGPGRDDPVPAEQAAQVRGLDDAGEPRLGTDHCDPGRRRGRGGQVEGAVRRGDPGPRQR